MGTPIWHLIAPFFLVTVRAGLHDVVAQSYYETPQSSSPAPQSRQYIQPEPIGMKEIVLFLTPDQVEVLQAAGAVVQPYPEFENDYGELQEQYRVNLAQKNVRQNQAWVNPNEYQKFNAELQNYYKFLNIQEINDDLAQQTQATEGTTVMATTTPRYKYTKARQQYKEKEFSTPYVPKKSRTKISNQSNHAEYVRFLPNYEHEILQMIPYQALPLTPYQLENLYIQESVEAQRNAYYKTNTAAQQNPYMYVDTQAQLNAYAQETTDSQQNAYSQGNVIAPQNVPTQVNTEEQRNKYSTTNTVTQPNKWSQANSVPQQNAFIQVNLDTPINAYSENTTEGQRNAFSQVDIVPQQNTYKQVNSETQINTYSQETTERQRNEYFPATAQQNTVTQVSTEAQQNVHSLANIVTQQNAFSEANTEPQLNKFRQGNAETQVNAYSQQTTEGPRNESFQANIATIQNRFTDENTKAQQNAFSKEATDVKQNAYSQESTASQKDPYSQKTTEANTFTEVNTKAQQNANSETTTVAQQTANTVAYTETQQNEFSQAITVTQRNAFSQASTTAQHNTYSQPKTVVQETVKTVANIDTQQNVHSHTNTEAPQNIYSQTNTVSPQTAFTKANTKVQQNAYSRVNKGGNQRNVFRRPRPSRVQVQKESKKPQVLEKNPAPVVTQKPTKHRTYIISQDTKEFKETLSSIEGLPPLPPLELPQKKPASSAPPTPTVQTPNVHQDHISHLLAPLYQHQTITESIARQKEELIKSEYSIRTKLQKMKDSPGYYDQQEYTAELEKLTRNFGQQNALAKMEATTVSNISTVFLNQGTETTESHPIELEKSTEFPMLVRIPKPHDVKILAPTRVPIEFMQRRVPKPVVERKRPVEPLRNFYVQKFKVQNPYTMQKINPFTEKLMNSEQLTIIRHIWEH